MKKYTIAFVLIIFMPFYIWAQTYGELTVSASTSEAGGNYDPRNCVAIWIENDNGEFVKTLMAYAQGRRTHLNIWQASTGAAGTEYNTIDAITGATRNSHAIRTCTWNGLDYNDNLMEDGSYQVWMELTDKNNTGNYSSFTFLKGIDPDSQNPFDVPSFSDISIHWQPSGTGISEGDQKDLFTIANNPSSGLYMIRGPQFEEYTVSTMSGEMILRSTDKSIDITKERSGMYLLSIMQKDQKTIKKIIKN